MKLYKVFLALGACLSLANCKYSFSGNGEIVEPPPHYCLDRLYSPDGLNTSGAIYCELDIKQTPKKMVYFHGGWYGPSPNYRLSMEITRVGNSVSAHVVAPKCTIDGSVSQGDYLALNALTSSVDVKINDVQMMDGGNEYLDIVDDDGSDRLFLKIGDSTYRKPVVRDAKVAEAIRKQVNVIADAILAKCAAKTAITSIQLRQNVHPKTMEADKDAQRPHPTTALTTQDLRVTHLSTGTVVKGYRSVVSPFVTCQTEINATISNDAAWRAATAKIKIIKSTIICAKAQGASDEDWRIVFPKYPKQLQVNYSNGLVDIGNYGCEYADRVENSKEIEDLLTKLLASKAAKCRDNPIY